MRRRTIAVALAALLALAGCTAGGGDATGREASAPNHSTAERDNQGGDRNPLEDPQSTFAVDVDTASYGYARRVITEGSLPDPTMVRPEEFVNAFDQDYPEPRGDGFAIHADGARPPAAHETGDDVRIMRVGLQTRGEEAASRPDASLTFVVDVSGSMAEPGRLDLVRDALHTLVDQLRPTDSVAIVAFSSEADVLREMTRVSEKDDLHAAIRRLRPDASTNLAAGLTLGYRVARDGFREGTSNRVIVLSDGLANTGSTDADTILRRVRDEAAKEIALLGVGVGSDYGDALMERLADGGDGFAVYVSEPDQARDVFVHRLPATLEVRALDAKVQVTFDGRTVRDYRLIGYENRAVADEDFRDDRVDGGEVGPGHSVTALYEVRLAGDTDLRAPVATVRARWLDPATREPSEASRPVTVADLDAGFEAAAPRFTVDYVAAYLAVALRGDRGSAIALAELRRIADRAADRTEDPAVRELADLVDRAASLN
ncbi:von Willebrand factor type A domain-containing protein [Asanoa sp. WMMD1127]|uniref:vWA domain-containing protein n=1 Tax=Asanoa sp. WMMD1127 TaxID=3016107 RepID=UPI002416F8CC|nr:von Willebrand factor type A domain-containing protein [Asanoa sp. WMMD1127]MDG4824768.1 von Willebrand factor type A domain-containing protein [Asanoa sp. WMMD1127]